MGRARRIATGLSAGSIAVASFLLAAPGASAANLGTFTWNGVTFADVSVAGEVNDTFTLVNNGGVSGSLQNDTGTARRGSTNCTGGGFPACDSQAGSTHVFTVTQTGRLGVHGNVSQLLGYITITSASAPSSSTANRGPAPVLQQFAKPATDTCDAAQPTGLNWSGVASGGWSESWAQWANGGRGGSVCTRTLGYSSGWAVVN